MIQRVKNNSIIIEMKNIYTLLFVTCIGISSFAQDAAKMKKHLRVSPTDKFDKTATISFGRKISEKHGFEEIAGMFKNSFVAHKFKVQDNSQYVLEMDYKYGYVISQYRFQYSDLTAEVLDLTNNRAVVATINYDGRFEIDAVAEAVAVELEKATAPKIPIVNANDKAAKPSQRTKEERLTELKNLFEKQLITKEDYDKEKSKVLSEN